MNVEYINPFIESITTNMEKIAGIQSEMLSISISKIAGENMAVSAVIGLSEELRGSAVLSFPYVLALKIASNMLMEKFSDLNADVLDALGEFTNIIVGNARNVLVNSGLKINISTPTLIRGNDLQITAPKGLPFIVAPFKTKNGIFRISVSVAKEK